MGRRNRQHTIIATKNIDGELKREEIICDNLAHAHIIMGNYNEHSIEVYDTLNTLIFSYQHSDMKTIDISNIADPISDTIVEFIKDPIEDPIVEVTIITDPISDPIEDPIVENKIEKKITKKTATKKTATKKTVKK